MSMIRKIFFIIYLAVCASMPCGAATSNDSLRIEVLLKGSMVENVFPNEKFTNSLDITSNHLILLSSQKNYYVLGWGGIVPIGKKVDGTISSFACTSDNLLMTIRDNEVCTFDSLGHLTVLYTLPNRDMGITAGKYFMYVYDKNRDIEKKALYVIAHGGKYAKLFEVPTSIESVVEYNNSIVFASGNTVYLFSPKNKEMKALAVLPEGKIIKSLTVDSLNNRIYFSTDSITCALKDSTKVLISDKLGGILRFYQGGLIIFNPEKNFLVRLVDIENQITAWNQNKKNTSGTESSNKVITNATIIELVNNQLSDELIIKIINKSKVNFNLSIDSLISLSEQHVSSPVIKAMKIASKKQQATAP